MNPLKNEINLIGFKISSYRTESTLHVFYRANLLTLFKYIIAIYPERQMNPSNTPCGQNSEFLKFKEL
jgi:hypothetical protein